MPERLKGGETIKNVLVELIPVFVIVSAGVLASQVANAPSSQEVVPPSIAGEGDPEIVPEASLDQQRPIEKSNELIETPGTCVVINAESEDGFDPTLPVINNIFRAAMALGEGGVHDGELVYQDNWPHDGLDNSGRLTLDQFDFYVHNGDLLCLPSD